jgi:DNA modification methylase
VTVIFHGDARTVLASIPDRTVQTCVTSPPYFGLRAYLPDGHPDKGLDPTPDAYVADMVALFREVRRVLRDDGTLWLNLGDSYAGSGKGAWDIPDDEKKRRGVKESYRPNKAIPTGKITQTGFKPKDLIGIPWRVAFALQADGWYLRQDLIWHKPNPMPESVTDRCTKAHEYIFLMSKSPRYYFDQEAIKEPAVTEDRTKSSWKTRKNSEPARRGDLGVSGHVTRTATLASGEGRNPRSVWTVGSRPYKGAHFATFPPDLITPCILAGAPPGGLVLDPFLGSGTTAVVAAKHGRECWGIELNAEYIELAKERLCELDAPVIYRL